MCSQQTATSAYRTRSQPLLAKLSSLSCHGEGKSSPFSLAHTLITLALFIRLILPRIVVAQLAVVLVAEGAVRCLISDFCGMWPDVAKVLQLATVLFEHGLNVFFFLSFTEAAWAPTDLSRHPSANLVGGDFLIVFS